MAKPTVSMTVRLDGAREALAAVSRSGKAADAALRAASTDLAASVARRAAAAGKARGRQATLVAGTVKAARDRVPVVQAGGSKRVGSRRVPAYKLLFGAEFGSDRHRQFGHGHTGRKGMWFFPTVEAMSGEIARRWRQAADEVVRSFSRGG